MSGYKTDRRVIIITRQTRLEDILVKENTISQARFKLSSLNSLSQNFAKSDESNTELDMYEEEHEKYQNSVSIVKQQMQAFAPVQMLHRKYLPNFMFNETDIVVCIGQDGLVANTVKYLKEQPVIGINPDKTRYDGILLPFEAKDALTIIKEVISGTRRHKDVRMAEAKLPDGQFILAVNDFFIGQKGHASARYIIKYNGLKEPQSSSGVIVSTGLGSTGWLKSVIAGAKGISNQMAGTPYGKGQTNDNLVETDEEIVTEMEVVAEPVMECCAAAPLAMKVKDVFQNFEKQSVKKAKIKNEKKVYGHSEFDNFLGVWESCDLVFAVREPFASKTSGTGIVFGKIQQGGTLRIESLMGENGVIFSDGIESDCLEFNSGMEVTIKLAEKCGNIVI